MSDHMPSDLLSIGCKYKYKYWVYNAQIVDQVESDARKHSLGAEGRHEIKCFQTTAKNWQRINWSKSVDKAFQMVGAATRNLDWQLIVYSAAQLIRLALNAGAADND
jgi:hypothetical protein